MTKAPNLVAILHPVKYIALERRVDSIEADPVVTTAYEPDIFGMRPAERHRCPGRSSAFQPAIRQIRGVPKLFRNHAASIGKPFNRFDKRHRIALSSEFIMAALARQYRPRASDPGPIKRATIVFLSIAIVIIAAPARTLGKIALNHTINDFD